MPIEEVESFEGASSLMEFRGIRVGEKGGNHPIRTRPKVKMPTKDRGSNDFKTDDEVMKKAAKRLDLHVGGSDDEVHLVEAIPVFLTSDEVNGESGVVYIERAFYTGSGRQCGSPAGTEKATQRVNVEAYARNKKLELYQEPKEVDCNSKCPMWSKPGEKSDCNWRAIVTVQLQDRPVFPSAVRLRTKSKWGIRYMTAGLKAIARETGGVLKGIPLWFRQYNIEKKDPEGKTRRIPVMTFEFDGTIQELRHYAAVEIASRKSVVNGAPLGIVKSPVDKTKFGALDDDDISETPVVGDDDDGEWEDGPPGKKEDNGDAELEKEIKLIAKGLDYTPAAIRALKDKHEGSLTKVRDELRASASPKAKADDEDWSSGEVGNEEQNSEDDGEKKGKSDDGFFDDDLWDDED